MLEVIRNNAQSWGVKFLFAIIVLVFVFWGVGSFRNSKRQVVATVGDREIGLKDFYQAYQRQVDALRRQKGEVSTDDLKRMDLKRQVLQQMINRTLIQAKAEELGLFVGSGQVRTKIQGMKVFQTGNATFDPVRYQNVLRMNNLTPAQFESNVRIDLVSSALQDVVTSPVQVKEDEAKALFEYVQGTASIDAVRFRAGDYTQGVQVQEKEISSYYDKHKQEFKIPAKMSMDALLLTPKTLASQQKVDSSEIEAYYKNHSQEFQQPEQVKARHILIRVAKDAPEKEVQQAKTKIEDAAARLAKGADFAQLAKEISEGPSASQGGDLGWFSRGSMVKPFEDAAFDLKPGQVSEPVRTRFGFHLIKVTGHREAGEKPLKEVRQKIRKEIAQNKAMGVLEDSLDQALQVVLDTGDLDKAAEAVGLETEQAGPFSAQNPPNRFKLDADQVQKLMQMQVGEVSDSPIMLKNGYLLVKKTDQQPAHIPALDTIKDTIRSKVTAQKALQEARKAAEKALTELQAGKTAQDLGLTVKRSKPFSRRGYIPGMGMNQELAKAAFGGQTGKWLDKPYKVDKEYVLARPATVTPPDAQTWNEQKTFWMNNVARMRRQALFQAYVQGLREKTEVTIQSPDVLKYS